MHIFCRFAGANPNDVYVVVNQEGSVCPLLRCASSDPTPCPKRKKKRSACSAWAAGVFQRVKIEFEAVWGKALARSVGSVPQAPFRGLRSAGVFSVYPQFAEEPGGIPRFDHVRNWFIRVHIFGTPGVNR